MCHLVSGRQGKHKRHCHELYQRFYGGKSVHGSTGQPVLAVCIPARNVRFGDYGHYQCRKHWSDSTAGVNVCIFSGNRKSHSDDFLCSHDGLCSNQSVLCQLKRGGILLIQIAVGSLYMFSVPRGYIDGFIQWCKQVIGICITAFLQSTILTAGLMVFKDHPLLGLGLMLSSTEVPRIAGQFGLDTSTKTNIMSSVYAAQTAINMTRTVVKAVAA